MYDLLLVLSLLLASGYRASAQSTEVQQLLLNVEKLSQLKNILEDAKKGYTVLVTGYNAVRDITSGNFSLHEFFLDGLMLVNPEIKKYRRVLDIITYQKQLISEYKNAFKRFSAGGNFNPSELDYLGRVYKNLFELSLDNLDELLTVITAAKLRMSDQERLVAIDRIYARVKDKLVFLRTFNAQALGLSLQRDKQKMELKSVSDLY
ncbi:TerB family tellurite resistance protein [Pedobacter steynii]|nr:TerB family tellurite resistance protein [Pedobacter steynii]